MSMSVGERDKLMSDMASIAAEGYCDKFVPLTAPRTVPESHIRGHPQSYLQHTVPYITVRALHRHEKALKSMETDSRWIKFLTVALVALTIVLAIYAWRLDEVMHSLQ